jgi:hypothetical protein
MDMQLMRQAIKAYPHSETSTRKSVKHNRMQYIRARLRLGDKYILLAKVAHKHRDAVVAGVVFVLAPIAIVGDVIARGL